MTYMHTTRNVVLSIKPEVIERMDDYRGYVPRSKFFIKVVEEYIKAHPEGLELISRNRKEEGKKS